MRIDKIIKGEKFGYYIQFIPNEMKATVRYFQSDESIICEISSDFKYINLPDDYLSPYITGIGRVKVGKLKLNKRLQDDAKFYNNKQ